MIRRPPRSTLSSSSAASDVYKRQDMERMYYRALLNVAQDSYLPSGKILHCLRRLFANFLPVIQEVSIQKRLAGKIPLDILATDLSLPKPCLYNRLHSVISIHISSKAQ